MARSHDIVFLFDVDDTLLDNDGFQDELRAHLVRAFGREANDRYWRLFEESREEFGYADYLAALERYRAENLHDPRLLRMSNWFIDYPFAERLYRGALEAVGHVRKSGLPVILSDGDAVFQPRKVERSGLWHAFEGHVLIYIHKEAELENVRHFYPARHYVVIDDKIRILDAIKKLWQDRVTTVFVEQGHYAKDKTAVASYPAADLTIRHIGELKDHNFAAAMAD
jgi:FMN phosphatase YigB (HAD superfamily)